MNTEKRSNAQDIVKGFLIISVVFFHANLLLIPDSGNVTGELNILYSFFPYLMVVFFFYAGHNHTAGKRSFKENVKRRTLQLLLPFLFCIFLGPLLVGLIVTLTGFSTWQTVFNSVILSLLSIPLASTLGFPPDGIVSFEAQLASGIIWFIYTLYIVSIFFFLLVPYTNKKLSRLISVVVALLIVSFCLGQFVGAYLPYSANFYPVGLAIMLTANYLKEHSFLTKPLDTKKDVAMSIINMVVGEGIVIGVSLLMYYQYGALLVGVCQGGSFSPVIKGYDTFIAFLFSIVGTYAIHTLARFIEKIPLISTALAWMGKSSALIFIFHPVLFCVYHTLFFRRQSLWGVGQSLLYVGLVVLTIFLIYIIVYLIKKKIKEKKAVVESTKEEHTNENV